MNFRLFTGLFLLFSFTLQAQQYIPLDTANVAFRKQLLAAYLARTSEQNEVFRRRIEDVAIRKEVDLLYKEITSDFAATITSGIFTNHHIYQDFLNGFLQDLKTANPEYPSLQQTEILISYGAEPNAYAIGNDIVVFYLPFIKKARNEYELAFVLCHELAHNILEHSVQNIVSYATLRNSEELIQKSKELRKKKYKRAGEARALYRDLVYGNSKMRRKQEQEADSLGFLLFQRAYPNHQYQAVRNFEHLKLLDKATDSLLPQDYRVLFSSEEQPFKEQWINNTEMDKYTYDKSPKFWMIDSLRSHPDSDNRARYIKQTFNPKETSVAPSSAGFEEVQTASKFDDLLGLFYMQEYGKSLYESLLLYKNDADNPFLKQLIYSNLVKLQEAQKNYTLNSHLELMNPYFSNSYNTFLFFMRELRRKEMNGIIQLYKP